MKDFDQDVTVDIIPTTVAAQVAPEKKLLSSHLLSRGHTLFECDTRTGVVSPVVYEETKAEFKPNMKYTVRKKVNQKEGCVYIGALNKKNALKKFLKLILLNNTNQK